jgi:3-hydroxyacyl-CoA dehydrogenase
LRVEAVLNSEAVKSLVVLEKRGTIAVVRVNHPPVNALSRPVRDGLLEAFDRIHADRSIQAVVLHAAGRTFIAGADISEFSAPLEGAPLNDVLTRIEGLDRPVVVAIHGTALGGGLETALACHYRVAARSAKIGFPEVTLGILPGAGGTQRLPRLAGVEKALDMILGATPVGAEEALAAGIVDRVVDGDVFEAALDWAKVLAASGTGPRRTAEIRIDPAKVPAGFFERRRAEVAKKAMWYPALERSVACVEAAVTRPFAEGLALEDKAFDDLRRSPQSEAMRHLFFAEREAAKIPGLSDSTPTRKIEKVGVVGAGTMGGGITMAFVNAGYPVVLVEASQEALDRGLGVVRKNFEITAAKGKLTPAEVERRMGLITPTLDYGALGDRDLVVEAVFENMDLKKQIAARLGQVCRPGAIVASNTSTLDVDVLGRAFGRPSEFLGMHFFSPANVMRLLEVVRGKETAPEVLLTVVRLAKSIRKVAVVSGVCFGFIGNRMLESYLREAEALIMEGASPARIDATIQSLGLPMGPCRMADMAGVDVCAKVVIERKKEGGLPPDPSYRAVVQKLHELGRHGQKSGTGYYRYDGRNAIPDPAVDELAAALAKQHGIARRTDITDDEVVERCLYPLINEGARILEEGISYRPGDIDVVWISGYGFPDHKGGPMYLADALGAAKIVKALERYASKRGNPFGYWTVSKLLARAAREGLRFAAWPLN